MGMEIEVDTLEQMCALMCDNYILEGRDVYDYAKTLRGDDPGDHDRGSEGSAGSEDQATND